MKLSCLLRESAPSVMLAFFSISQLLKIIFKTLLKGLKVELGLLNRQEQDKNKCLQNCDTQRSR